MAARVSYRCVSCDRVIRGLATVERHIKQEHGAGRYEQVGCIPAVEGRDE